MGLIEPFNGPTREIIDGAGNVVAEIQRDVFFDFQPNQLVYGVGPDPFLGPTDRAKTDILRDGDDSDVGNPVEFFEVDLITAPNVAIVAAYQQGSGPSDGDNVFRYRDSASYNIPPFAYVTQVPGDPNSDTRGRSAGDPLVPDDFANAKTFQLVAAGLDGDLGVPLNTTGSADAMNHQRAFALSTDSNFVKLGYDNMVNFAAGRLELFVIENE